uniref:Uncharacterized protein n=1 Tax=Rousettus aegyptiacus TaxID=9407 RepID=A0A7J8B9H0_ROUAE|nr:hypothetical protein HJG63_009907 [Rousettus aegyptiacus]
MCVYKGSCKELAHAIMEAGKSSNLQDGLSGWRPRRSQRCSSSPKCLAEFSLAQGRATFCSIQTVNQLATHATEGSLFYSVTDLNINFILKHPTETFKIMFDHLSGYRDPAKLTHKIDHHKPQPKSQQPSS